MITWAREKLDKEIYEMSGDETLETLIHRLNQQAQGLKFYRNMQGFEIHAGIMLSNPCHAAGGVLQVHMGSTGTVVHRSSRECEHVHWQLMDHLEWYLVVSGSHKEPLKLTWFT